MAPLSARILVHVLFCGLALLLCKSPAIGGPTTHWNEEYRSKASFLYNCCHFIQWPESAFASTAAPITIGLFGGDPFGSPLEELTQNSTIRGRPIHLLRTRRIEDAANCHLLFIHKSETPRLRQVFAAIKGRPVVTVGESDAFLAAGGMVALISERTTVRLRINTTMVQAANVTVSSKLLRIATQR